MELSLVDVRAACACKIEHASEKGKVAWQGLFRIAQRYKSNSRSAHTACEIPPIQAATGLFRHNRDKV
ncbi:MAG TPA: hypothetical protein VIT92_01620, partial [Burkholderiaceae bacterium]